VPKIPARFWIGSTLFAAAAAATISDAFSQWRSLSDGWAAIVMAVPMAVKSGSVALGAYLLWRGWPRRFGRARHCRKCGYTQENHGRIIGPCPECGAPWRWIGRFRTGQRRSHSWMLTCGAALLVLVIGTWLLKHMAPGVLLTWMPTNVLLQQLGNLPDDELSSHWTEFDQRRIPREKLEDLAQALMRKKVRDGYLSRPSQEAVFMWINSTTTPQAAALGRQFYSQVLSTEMKAPDTAELGEQIAVRTSSTFRGGTIVAQPEPRLEILTAIYIDGNPEPAQTWAWPVRAITDDQVRPFTHLFKPARAGTIEVKQKFWLMVGGQGEVTLGAGGPILPPGMTILNEFEIGKSIDVQDPRKTAPARKITP
jgi:hypothetical protein